MGFIYLMITNQNLEKPKCNDVNCSGNIYIVPCSQTLWSRGISIYIYITITIKNYNVFLWMFDKTINKFTLLYWTTVSMIFGYHQIRLFSQPSMATSYYFNFSFHIWLNWLIRLAITTQICNADNIIIRVKVMRMHHPKEEFRKKETNLSQMTITTFLY